MKSKLITIGRQYGSGGRDIARVIGEKLGISVFDRELIARAASESGLSPQVFDHSDEKRSFLRLGSIFGSNRYGAFSRNPLSDAELFRVQSETMRRIASEGDAVFVGRAADYVLRDMDCLDVFVCAPLQERIRRTCERRGVDAAEADAFIRHCDAEREKYYNYFTFTHWGVASNYDLCVDSSVLGIEGTADLIIDFYKRSL